MPASTQRDVAGIPILKALWSPHLRLGLQQMENSGNTRH